MGLKILTADNELIYEFSDNGTILLGFIMRAKFSNQFDSQVTFNPIINNLFKAVDEAREPLMDAFGNPLLDYPSPIKAPQSYIDTGMTDSDYGFRQFFDEFTKSLANNHFILERWDWQNCDRKRRHELIRVGLYPHSISDARLDEMIGDIDRSLLSAVSLYNPDY